MGIQTIYKRSGYVPFTDDPNLRTRIQQTLDRGRNIPAHIAPSYPDRGNDIDMKCRIILQGSKVNEILTEPSALKEQVYLSDTLCVLCAFGNDQGRIEAQKTAIKLLSEMNPLPRVVLIEGSTDGGWYFDYVKTLTNFDYIPVNLNYPQFRNFFGKEMLWNQAAHTVLDNVPGIKYLVFMDADTFFVDRMGWDDIRKSFDKYDIISPFKHCYYMGNSKEAQMYKMLPSTGYKVVSSTRGKGYQGFGFGCSVDAYNYYFNGELPNPSLGMGDGMYWYMLCGNSIMKGFTMLPYCEEALRPFVIKEHANIGCTSQVLGHVDHGPVDARVYKVRSMFMRLGVREPLAETARIVDGGYLIGWADNPIANDLRLTYEHVLVENRREIKVATFEDAKWYYEWFHGMRKDPPKCILPNRFTKDGNMLPNWECSRNVFSNKSSL